jgi:uncharacterized Zn finger protein
VDALVEVIRRDLSQSHFWLEIAQALTKAKRHDEALHWAEQGSHAFPGHPDSALDDFLVAEYHRRKRHDDAVALRWTRYTQQLTLHAYQDLAAAASIAKTWPQWRAKALAALERPIAPQARPRLGAFWSGSSKATLIEIHLWEGDVRAALKQARATSCTPHLWLDIARRLEAESPEDAIAVYRAQVDPIVQGTNTDAYDRAVDIARRVRELMKAAGRSSDLEAWTADLRARHKAKRNLMKRLDRLMAERSSLRK